MNSSRVFVLGLVCLLLVQIVCVSSGIISNLPLSTKGSNIVDSKGNTVRLAGVNWYGTDQQDYVVGGLEANSLDNIIALILKLVFNAVRFPFSNYVLENNPAIASKVLAANPQLVGKRALDIMDIVVKSLASNGLLVMLDNHISDANWCCSDTDGNGVWYNKNFTVTQWQNDWISIVQRYQNIPQVFGVDLRNEPRSSYEGTPVWSSANSTLNWRLAAQQMGNRLLQINPNLLIVVEGLNYALDLTGVKNYPIQLSVSNKIVYSSHNYEWDTNNLKSYSQLETYLNNNWAYISQNNVAPIILGEFGTCHSNAADCVANNSTQTQGFWFQSLIQFLQAHPAISWFFWALNGTQSSGSGRTWGAEEGYGILNLYYNATALNALTQALAKIQQ
eukprot:TRINITY_DN2532_c0_g1_i3.p1 TRINITY_DN2532_c0_g1~~TRINITY_DN2532_c0_g1_i3.p1  ORF type:complete len:390 (-),score=76.43 TRINITY_DN2532_c0_g1_i3:93-1262(-)